MTSLVTCDMKILNYATTGKAGQFEDECIPEDVRTH